MTGRAATPGRSRADCRARTAPLKALVFQGTISTILIVAIYMATGLSCIDYYLRERRTQFNVARHGLIPLASFVLFIRSCWPRSASSSPAWC